ncbi:MBL fold metallo-hydrolase [Paenibacillus mendelii]|uniref:MBL fold metallo-hydrolase n=1 Tax=Paenibacillus mendelii TaxID=206163 RepID=A0ABV6JBC0_9BACL|nr:MBL fold metallo-hydrolase [Paenibacillus mendelii]MCQ6558533.1 MBL fold metallo-hydrolase [Paenibacillus mendelii]
MIGNDDRLSAVKEWPGGILQVKVPLPFSLKWVNSYLIADREGYTLLDPGLHTSEAVELWTYLFRERDIPFGAIHTIILTHQHPDHYGLSGWFQQRSGAPVYLSAQSHAYALRLWGSDRSFAADLTELYARHGMPEPLLDDIIIHLEQFVARVSPQPEVTYLEAGSTIRFGGLDWQTIDAPGHARGQLCLYAPERRLMICGDQVLPDITPNVSIVPGEDEDPLQCFIDSLNELRHYEVELAFPGHRAPFNDFRGRIDELIAHHKRRLDAIVELLRETPGTGYDMCMRLFGERISGNTHHLRFAMSETLAHLIHLERAGQIKSDLRGDYITYYAE